MQISMLAVPGLLAAPIPGQALARQWKAIYDIGKFAGPASSFISILGNSYLAKNRMDQGEEWGGFVSAALLAISIIPYTAMFMLPTNNALMGVANGTIRSLGDDAVRKTLQRWGALNFGRSLLTLAATIVCLWNLLK